jgi:hypothetical protein
MLLLLACCCCCWNPAATPWHHRRWRQDWRRFGWWVAAGCARSVCRARCDAAGSADAAGVLMCVWQPGLMLEHRWCCAETAGGRRAATAAVRGERVQSLSLTWMQFLWGCNRNSMASYQGCELTGRRDMTAVCALVRSLLPPLLHSSHWRPQVHPLTPPPPHHLHTPPPQPTANQLFCCCCSPARDARGSRTPLKQC